MTSYHRAQWRHEAGDTPSLTFTCTAPDSEPCRQKCGEDQCEYLPCDHMVTAPKGECLFVEWFDATGDAQESFTGNEPPRDGAVEPEWQGDYYTWDYVPLNWAQREIIKGMARW